MLVNVIMEISFFAGVIRFLNLAIQLLLQAFRRGRVLEPGETGLSRCLALQA